MTRKIKGLGLAFVAIAAMSMVAAAGAQATQLHATTPNTASIFAERTAQDTINRFTTVSGTVQCTTSTFEGTAEQASSQQVTTDDLTVTPTYSGCTAFGLAAQVVMNGCQYRLTGTDNTAAGATFPNKTAEVDVVCTAGKQIEIKAVGGCTVTVPSQNHLEHVVFQNNPAALPVHDVTIHATAAGIKYEPHGICPNNPAQTVLRQDGNYHGTLTGIARKDENGTLTTKDGHQWLKLSQQGVQVGLIAT